jgi:GntR family transcriptional regulator/MocR family aminotransferase
LTSRPLDLLVAVDRARPRTLGRQIEDQLRAAIRDNTLRQGTRLPSTRDLARELGVSRPIVVDAYAQLAGEGYLELRPGARPRVAGGRAAPREAPAGTRPEPAAEPKYDFRPGVPDLSSFPRSAWLRSVREALSTMRDADLGYTDPHGTEVLRLALRDYLGRVRGVVADAGRVVITSGYCQGRSLVCRALVSLGAKRVAVEDPCHDEVRSSVVGAGLTLVPLPVDADGLRIEALEEVKADAVIVTPAHQYPTGAVLSGQRRGALLEWLRRRGTFALEDDYDAEYRYDRAPVGALQALDPERIVYAGTASKTLAPALRLGWLVVPPRLTAAVQQHQRQMDFGVSRIEQHAFADFLSRGELDRHLRRMRVRYRARRDALVETLTEALPEVRVHGIRAGLHLAVQLRDGDRARTIRTEALRRGVALTAMSDYYLERAPDSAMLLLGYGRISEAGIRAGVRELAAAVRSTRRLGG